MKVLFNFASAPGTAKTTLSSGVFSCLKERGVKVEYSHEEIKDKVYERGSSLDLFDQISCFKSVMTRESLRLTHTDVLVCECPSFLSAYYCHRYMKKFEQAPSEFCSSWMYQVWKDHLDGISSSEVIRVWVHQSLPSEGMFSQLGRIEDYLECRSISGELERHLRNLEHEDSPRNKVLFLSFGEFSPKDFLEEVIMALPSLSKIVPQP